MPIDTRYAGPQWTTSTDDRPAATTTHGAGTLGPAGEWQTGTHFSRYQIDSRLATGGMAEVWRARLKGVRGFEKRIVLKTMLPHLMGRGELVEMFINEATVASAFSHPNIVHVFDFGQLEGRYFIAMEFVPGVTLRFAHKRMLARGERLPIPATLHILADVCEALHAVHDLADDLGPLGLVHRDLSPDNVILSTSGAAKLIDFGASRATTRTPSPNVFVGKYRYSAPERIRRGEEDRRSDVYSVGVILYECLTGVRPFDGPDSEIIGPMGVGRICDPRERVPALSTRLAEIVIRATAPDRADRFATARELGDALLGCLDDFGSAGKERDVTASLAALIEDPAEPPLVLTAQAADDGVVQGVTEASSSGEVALCEVEIIEASGPIAARPEPPTLPTIPARAEAGALALTPPPRPRDSETPAPHWSLPGQLFDRVFGGPPVAAAPGMVLGWRRTPDAPPPEIQRAPVHRAVELFDRGIELRAGGRYGEALQAWERALALAPDNQVYRSNVNRLRQQLDELRRAQLQIADWDAV
jgi:serine/threonine protein kinase